MFYLDQKNYKMANKAVAELCNHKKTVSSKHAQTMANAENRVLAQKIKVKVLERELVLRKKVLKIKEGKLDPKLEFELKVKTEPEFELMGVKSKEKDQMNLKERADIRKKHMVEVNEEKPIDTVEEEEEVVMEKELKPTNKAVLKERVAKCKEQLKNALEKLEKAETDWALKEEMKEIALGTSKLNYLDPRITVQWCKTHKVPLEKVKLDD